LKKVLEKYNSNSLSISDFPVGKSKIFMKVTSYNYLNNSRELALWDTVVRMQAMIKGFLVRRRLRKRKVLIQRAVEIVKNPYSAKEDEIEGILNEDENLDIGIGAALIKDLEDIMQFIHFRDTLKEPLQKAIDEKNGDALAKVLEDCRELNLKDSEALALLELGSQLLKEMGIDIESKSVHEESEVVPENTGPEAEYNSVLIQKQNLEGELKKLESQLSVVRNKILQCDQALLKLSAGISRIAGARKEDHPPVVKSNIILEEKVESKEEKDYRIRRPPRLSIVGSPHGVDPQILAFRNNSDIKETIDEYAASNSSTANRDYTSTMLGIQNRYFLSGFNQLRDKDNFSKRTFFRTKSTLKDNMYSFSRVFFLQLYFKNFKQLFLGSNSTLAY
jgi:myosin heavy subunit